MKLINIIEFVQEIDRIPEIMELKIGKWCIWPILKPPLYFFLVRHNYDKQQIIQLHENSKPRLKLRKKRLGWLLHGILKIVVNKRRFHRPHILFITNSYSRRERLDDGSYFDIFTDELILSNELKSMP